MTQDANFWTLEAQIGRLSRGGTHAQVNLAQPNVGVQAMHVDSVAINGQLLALAPSGSAATWPAKLADAYVRGQDLVATYAGVDDWPYATQVYWSAEAIDDGKTLASLSLVVSIQTNLLDTHPRIDVRSAFLADELLRVSVAGDNILVDSHVDGVQSLDSRTGSCGLVWRLPGEILSYAEIMPTSDFHQLMVRREASGEMQSHWELFAEFLEKGVIRRARLQALVLPRENDVQLVAECCQAIETRPPPLTT